MIKLWRSTILSYHDLFSTLHLVLSTGFYSRSSGLDLPEARERVGFEVDLHYNGAMKLADRIEVNPEIAFGKPVVAGTRMAVGFILDLLAGGWDMTDILREYPHLKEEDVEDKLSSAVTPMVMVNFSLANNANAKDEADRLIAEVAPKVITLIKTMYEPVMYDIISMAVLTMVLRKYAGFLVGVTDDAGRFVALIPPKYTKREKMPK